MNYANIVFFQGEDAEPLLKGIRRVGEQRVVDYMSGWDNGEYYDVSTVPGGGSNDTAITIGDYRLTYNSAYQIAGLERMVSDNKPTNWNPILFPWDTYTGLLCFGKAFPTGWIYIWRVRDRFPECWLYTASMIPGTRWATHQGYLPNSPNMESAMSLIEGRYEKGFFNL